MRYSQLPRERQTIHQRHETEDAEGAIDQPPVERDLPDRAADEREGKDEETRGDADVEHPFIPHGRDEGADEKERDDEMAKGQPVGAVGDEGKLCVRFTQAVVDIGDPVRDAAVGMVIGGIGDAKERREEGKLMQQRKRRDARKRQRDDE